ncbi:MAG TPA: hypothetical protein VL460_02300 [Caulobacteraceae bacterium]|nr:hypothetical protein [Caulobacteraceae bacterium]
MTAIPETVVFHYNPLARLPMLIGCTLFGLLGCALSLAQLSAAAGAFQAAVLGLFSALFALTALAGWAMWGANVVGGPAARLTAASAELRGFGSRVVIDRTAPGLTLDWRRNGLLVSPAAAVTVLRRGVLRARALPGDRAWAPIEYRTVWKGAKLVAALDGGRSDL